MPPAQPTSYDTIPYPSRVRSQTHPDRLATVATLLGLQPAPVEQCRVLELGCGDGTNLVALAASLPGSAFVGLDLAPTAVEKARAFADAVGVSNVAYTQGDICDVTVEWGTFDYVIAHGIYSWVPEAVRDALLSVCRRVLAPHGVAFVSYNAYPGGHIRNMFREMMLMQVQQFTDPQERVDQARALLQFVGAGAPPGSPYEELARYELARVLDYSMGYLCHDDIADLNRSFYIGEFATHARQHGLQYLSEADFFETQHDQYPEAVAALLARLADQGQVIEREQMLDFLKGRRFRQTLLCRAERVVDRRPRPDLVPRLFLTSARPGASAEGRDGAVEFASATCRVTTDDPTAIAVLHSLRNAWPACVTFDDLVADLRVRLGSEPDREHVQGVLWRAFCVDMAELHVHRPPIASEPGDRPAASALARAQVRQGLDVTTLRYTTVNLRDELSRAVLALADGTRDRQAFAKSVAEAVGTSDDAEVGKFLRATPEERLALLDGRLRALASLALLTGEPGGG
jgi:SAM-dependent methyltransferase